MEEQKQATLDVLNGHNIQTVALYMEKLTINMLRDTAKDILPIGGKVLLYGSRARGEAHEGSDWDLLVLVDKPALDADDYEKICYPLVVTGWKHGEDVSPQLYTKKEWDMRSITPYHANVEKDKVVIYESK